MGKTRSEQIVECIKEGMTMAETAERLGFPFAEVRETVADLNGVAAIRGVTPAEARIDGHKRVTPAKFNPQRTRQWDRMYERHIEDGVTITQAAREMGVSPSAALRAFERRAGKERT